MLKRCFYISNSYDGAYFVLTDNIEHYIQKMASYVINLEGSKKTNHYSFGSIEMTDSEYQKHTTEASRLESSLIKKKSENRNTLSSDVPIEDENEEKVTVPQQSESSPKKKGHLTLIQ